MYDPDKDARDGYYEAIAEMRKKMGKRSDFERKPRDFYPTPEKAVLPLLPQLQSGDTFDEPCAGDGTLARHLGKAGHECLGISDIEPRDDFIGCNDVLTVDFTPADYFITNPPWPSTGSKGEPTISIAKHLSGIAPTWLLLSADFAHNKYFSRLHCKKIVSVGRVSWEENGVGGKDNVAWYLFVDKPCKTEFIGRDS